VKILNLYAGIGGNRKLWGNEHEITAIENNKQIARIYQEFFPDDIVLITDAHDYLLNYFKGYDFIWSSPPCPSHSRIRRFLAVEIGQNKPVYPDMKLYEEIVFLKSYFEGKWVVENVIGFYEPLIKPFEVASHYIWSNVFIDNISFIGSRQHNSKISELEDRKGFDLTHLNVIGIEKELLLRNCVEPELGKHIFDCVFKDNKTQIDLEEFM